MRHTKWWRSEAEFPAPGTLTFREVEVDGGYVDVRDVRVTIEFTDNRGARIEFTGEAESASVKTVNDFTQQVHNGALTAYAAPVSFGMREFEAEAGTFEWRYV